jgi:copper(I)-binding protein
MVMLHQSSVDASGVAHMWPVASLELRPGESVRFEPGGRQVMFTGLTKPLRVGTPVPLTLEFDGGEKAVTVLLEVRPLVAADAPVAGHAYHSR